jgi:hypothetical protein
MDAFVLSSAKAQPSAGALPLGTHKRNGHYVPNPVMQLRMGDGWRPVYDRLALHWHAPVWRGPAQLRMVDADRPGGVGDIRVRFAERTMVHRLHLKATTFPEFLGDGASRTSARKAARAT